MGKTSLALITLFFLFHAVNASANGNCYSPSSSSSSTNILTVNAGNKTITDPQENTPGNVKDPFYSWNGFRTSVQCNCPPNPSAARWVLTSVSDMPLLSDGWMSISPYLSTKIRVNVGNLSDLQQIPFDNLDAQYPRECNGKKITTDAASGTTGNMALRIEKSFVGTSYINNVKIADLYSCQSTDGTCVADGHPTMVYYINGSVTVPQNCFIKSGSQVVVDLGSFYSGDFNTIGQKPDDYTPKTFNIPVKCNNISAEANLTFRIQGTSSTGFSDALQSDNTDIGVVITDSSGTPLRPNDTTSTIPLTLDSNYETNVTLQAYPVSTTGNTPAEGVFTTLAYLRVDFA